jgi:ribose-phosphate pyrophosphokinase
MGWTAVPPEVMRAVGHDGEPTRGMAVGTRRLSREQPAKSFLWNMSVNPCVPLALTAKPDKSPIGTRAVVPQGPCMKLFAGNSNRVLAEAVARYLNISLGRASVRRFADQEIFVEIQENVRGQDVFILQSTSYPTNDNLMELLIMIDAFMPLVGAAHHGRHPLFRLCPPGSPRLGPHADLGEAGRQPDHRSRRRPRADARSARRPDPGFLRYSDRQSVRGAGHGARREGALQPRQRHGVSPDVGGVVRARALAKRVDAQLAIVDKRRERPANPKS